MVLSICRVSGPCPILLCAILHYASSQNGFPANKWDSDARPETSVRNVVDPVLRLDEQVLQFVPGNVGFLGGIETSEDGGGNLLRVLVQGKRLSGDLLMFCQSSGEYREIGELWSDIEHG